MPIRKVRQGRIKLDNRWWRPDETHKKYDGGLDGGSFVFLIYPPPTVDLVALWGTVAQLDDIHASDEATEVDGGFPWYFWYPVA